MDRIVITPLELGQWQQAKAREPGGTPLSTANDPTMKEYNRPLALSTLLGAVPKNFKLVYANAQYEVYIFEKEKKNGHR